MVGSDFGRDVRFLLALSDARKRENAERRAACQSDASLCAVLLDDAKRRGQTDIDWAEYFRNAGIS